MSVPNVRRIVMKNIKYIVQVLVLVCVVFVGTAFAAEVTGVFAKISENTAISEQGVKEISYAQFRRLKDSREPFALVNALPHGSFVKGHIPGSINMPVEKVGNKRAGKKIGPYDTNIVVYCGSFQCHASTNVAKALMELGYTNVVDYKGGTKEWQEKGNRLVTT